MDFKRRSHLLWVHLQAKKSSVLLVRVVNHSWSETKFSTKAKSRGQEGKTYIKKKNSESADRERVSEAGLEHCTKFA